MKSARIGLMLVLIWISCPSSADVFKYVDGDGKIYFTDEPLQGSEYRLEWKRASKKVKENSKRLIATGRHKHQVTLGRLSVPPKNLSVRRSRYAALIDRTARRFSLHPELLHAVIRAESAYNPNAVSSAGAIGLMQLMPATAARYKVSDIYDPVENVRGGAQYLRFLLDMFEHDLRLALAGYNAGENAVVKYGNRIPPYPETQQYVRKVMQFLWAERASAGR
ncbi:MAG: lytic transglycosylase domain-containing protein [Chromatiaceae bacterium]|jgi:soluble lytic murein transglycosylase-like protein|nr:lytic transglycosylase domain-containing protein [Chromatiaceae bacterium]